MVDGKYRPQSIPLGLTENGERKLEITLDVGEIGDHALQIRQMDSGKWSQWSDSLSIQVAKSEAPQAKLLKRKTTVKTETGLFSRTLSAGGVPLFLTQQQTATPDPTTTSSASPAATTSTPADPLPPSLPARPEKEGEYAEKPTRDPEGGGAGGGRVSNVQEDHFCSCSACMAATSHC